MKHALQWEHFTQPKAILHYYVQKKMTFPKMPCLCNMYPTTVAVFPPIAGYGSAFQDLLSLVSVSQIEPVPPQTPVLTTHPNCEFDFGF